MANFSALVMDSWLEQRILEFFNYANTYLDITMGLLKDDPANGSGYVLGEIVAERILERKAAQIGNKFTEISQLDSIAGLGDDKIHDIIYSLGIPAAEAFREAMYDEVIGENWQLEYHSVRFEDESDFLEVVNNKKAFRKFVVEEVEQIATERFADPKAAKKARRRMAKSCIETFESGHIGSFALALWFYRFDTDNWFTYDQVQEIAESYLDYFPFYNNRSELRMFKGFQNAGLLAQAVTVSDLPVVVNYAEQRITLWTASLSD